MPAYLVRHAKAGSRSAWEGPDEQRPLSAKGRQQAKRLTRDLADQGVRRIVSSPYLRCVETVEPLATRLGLPIEQDAALGEGASEQDAVALVRAAVADDSVLCTHGDVIPTVLDSLARSDGLKLPREYPFAKGSIWMLDGDGSGRITKAVYRKAP